MTHRRAHRAGHDAGLLRYRRVRLYESVRTAHLERAHALTPASIVYGGRRYDFDEALAAGLDLVPAGLARTARLLWRSPVTAVEINEPLMSSGLRRAAVAALVLRARHPRAAVVTYAIENKEPVPAGRGPRAVARAALERVLRRIVWSSLSRVVYGTEAARDLYARLLPDRGPRLRSTVIPAVPTPCGCGPLDEKDPALVVFLGALVPRKGFPLLLEAWPDVRDQHPGARLLVIGKGELEGLARERAAGDPSVTVEIDPPRERIHAHLRTAGVLVLPSQPTPTWREQVGLPIVEGLAHGCTIVTTTETGLASWLIEHGHEVLYEPSSVAGLATAVARALRASRPAASVLADLPDVDARLAADAWLFDEGLASPAGAPGAGRSGAGRAGADAGSREAAGG
jgi:glycosyltransferase involved in cell wall biosynthesis